MKIPGKNNSRHSLHTIRSKSYGVICLAILVFYLIRPLLPFVEYAIDKEYISKNLCVKRNIPGNCCQGKCYLHEQLKMTGEPLKPGTENNKKNIPDQKVEDHLKANGLFTCPFETVMILFCNYSSRIIDSQIMPFFVPPKY